MAFPGAAMGIAAGTGAINSTLNQGFNNGWNNISLPQIAFDGIMAGAMSYAGGQIQPSRAVMMKATKEKAQAYKHR